MKVDLDARTLEAMRELRKCLDDPRPGSTEWQGRIVSAQDAIREFVRAHDSARDAERDEALAKVLHASVGGQARHYDDFARSVYVSLARAARDFIAKEQGQ